MREHLLRFAWGAGAIGVMAGTTWLCLNHVTFVAHAGIVILFVAMAYFGGWMLREMLKSPVHEAISYFTDGDTIWKQK